MSKLNSQSLEWVNDPANFYCKIFSYKQSLSELIIIAHYQEFNFYLLFQNVVYFSGPLQWQNVYCRMGQTDECERLVRQSMNLTNLEGSILLALVKSYKLYLLGDMPIKIVANRVYYSEEIPQ